jgi:hypothetical protein
VDALGALNAADLAGENAALRLSLAAAAAFAIAVGGLLVMLVHAQLFLRRRFHRQVNDPLLAASVAVLLLAAWMGAQVVHTMAAAATANQAYAHLHDLWLARSLANDADGSVSLSLAAAGSGTEFDRAFAVQTSQLGVLLAGAAGGARPPGEREAAVTALRTHQRFLAAGDRLRAAVENGDQAGAVRIALGTEPDQLAVVFGELDEALGDGIAIDQESFASAIDAAGSPLGLDVGLPSLAVAIAVLALWGLQPRIAEYRE